MPGRVGAAILRVTGLYPHGTWFELANEELGIVVRQGSRVHWPLVAAVRRGDGTLHQFPVLRSSGEDAHAIARPVMADEANVRLDLLKVLSL